MLPKLKAIKKLISYWGVQLLKLETHGLSERQFDLVKIKLEPVLSGIFGYHSLLYSDRSKEIVSTHLAVRNSTVISTQQTEKSELICQFEQLPVASDCIDLVVIPELLGKSEHPHQILREVERVLIPEGHIILIISNPVSFTAIKNKMIALVTGNKGAPKLISRLRINDWFRLLGFEVTSEISLCLSQENRYPSKSDSWIKKISQISCEYFASYYIIVAKKKVSTMTPIRPSWRSNKKLVSPRLAEPSVKAHVENCVKQIIR